MNSIVNPSRFGSEMQGPNRTLISKWDRSWPSLWSRRCCQMDAEWDSCPPWFTPWLGAIHRSSSQPLRTYTTVSRRASRQCSFPLHALMAGRWAGGKMHSTRHLIRSSGIFLSSISTQNFATASESKQGLRRHGCLCGVQLTLCSSTARWTAILPLSRRRKCSGDSPTRNTFRSRMGFTKHCLPKRYRRS